MPEGTLVSVEEDEGTGGWGAVSVAVLDLRVGATMGSHKMMELTVESKRALTELIGALMVARWNSALPWSVDSDDVKRFRRKRSVGQPRISQKAASSVP